MTRKKALHREGLKPDEYRRQSTVNVERVRKPGEPERYDTDDLFATDIYHVVTRRDDGTWSILIELRGDIYRLPERVLQTINRQRASIIKEGRRVRGMEQAESRKEAS